MSAWEQRGARARAGTKLVVLVATVFEPWCWRDELADLVAIEAIVDVGGAGAFDMGAIAFWRSDDDEGAAHVDGVACARAAQEANT